MEDTKVYQVVTNTFCASGKDGYHHGFEEARVITSGEVLDVELLAECLKILPSPVTYEVDGRLTYVRKQNREQIYNVS